MGLRFVVLLLFYKETITFRQSFLLPTDTLEKCLKRSINIYITTVPTCSGVITIIRVRTFELVTVTFW